MTVGVLWWCGGVSVMTAVTSPVITRASPVVPQANERQLVETKKKKKRKKKKAAGKKITEDLEFLRKEFYYFHGIKFAKFY